MKKLTFVIPFYNVGDYITSCIESITVDSEFKKFDFIFVDDCGTDQSLEIVKKAVSDNENFQIIQYDENKGLGEARNEGLKHVTTEYVAFLDSDDTLNSGWGQAILKSFERDFDINIFECNYVDTQGKHLPVSANHKLLYSFTGSHIHGNVVAWGKIYKTKLFENVKYDSVMSEDYRIWPYLVAQASTITLSDFKMVNYLIRENSIMRSNNNWEKKFNDLVETFDMLLRDFSGDEIESYVYKSLGSLDRVAPPNEIELISTKKQTITNKLNTPVSNNQYFFKFNLYLEYYNLKRENSDLKNKMNSLKFTGKRFVKLLVNKKD